MSFRHPNLKDTAKKNSSHLTYISTRPGVDKTISPSDNLCYADYIDKKQKSHGLFDAAGRADITQYKDEVSEKKIVWRGIISMREVDARKVNIVDKTDWEALARRSIPDIAEDMGIKNTNMRWVAAFHREKGHPHLHFLVWEDIPVIKTGIISKEAINKSRKDMIDRIFKEERELLLQKKNSLRGLITEFGKSAVRDVFKLSSHAVYEPKLANSVEREISKRLWNIVPVLPGSGRQAYQYMPPKVKDMVISAVDYLISTPAFNVEVNKYTSSAGELAKLYTEKKDSINTAMANAVNDIKKRLCNVVLKVAVDISKFEASTMSNVAQYAFNTSDVNIPNADKKGIYKKDYSNFLSQNSLKYVGECKTVPNILSDHSANVIWQSIFATINSLQENSQHKLLFRNENLSRLAARETAIRRTQGLNTDTFNYEL